MSKKIKKEIAQKILDCYRGINWNCQVFVVNGSKMKDGEGETKFYKKSEIDKAQRKIDKLINSLFNAK